MFWGILRENTKILLEYGLFEPGKKGFKRASGTQAHYSGKTLSDLKIAVFYLQPMALMYVK
jgi:hypothetical protein